MAIVALEGCGQFGSNARASECESFPFIGIFLLFISVLDGVLVAVLVAVLLAVLLAALLGPRAGRIQTPA